MYPILLFKTLDEQLEYIIWRLVQKLKWLIHVRLASEPSRACKNIYLFECFIEGCRHFPSWWPQNNGS